MRTFKQGLRGLVCTLTLLVYAPTAAAAITWPVVNTANWTPSRVWQRTCEGALAKKEALFNFSREVIDTKGLRLLFRKAEAMDPDRFGMFLRQNENPKSRLKWKIYPVAAPYELFVEWPMRVASRTLTRGREYVLADLWLKIPIYFVVGYVTLTPMVEIPFEWLMHWKLDQREAVHGDLYDTLLHYDVRYKVLARDLKDHPEHASEIREYTISMRAIQVEYLQGIAISTPTGYHEYLDHPLFYELKALAEKGLQPQEGLIVPKDKVGAVPEEVLNKIAMETHALQVEQEILFQAYMFDGFKSLLGQLPMAENNPALPLKKHLDDPFWQQIQALWAQGKISNQKVLSALQQDLLWRVRFQQWEQLGVNPLSRDAQGQWTETVLTLEQIHKELIESILR